MCSALLIEMVKTVTNLDRDEGEKKKWMRSPECTTMLEYRPGVASSLLPTSPLSLERPRNEFRSGFQKGETNNNDNNKHDFCVCFSIKFYLFLLIFFKLCGDDRFHHRRAPMTGFTSAPYHTSN